MNEAAIRALYVEKQPGSGSLQGMARRSRGSQNFLSLALDGAEPGLYNLFPTQGGGRRKLQSPPFHENQSHR